MAKLLKMPEIYDPEAEQSVLGAVILDPKAFPQVADLLTIEHFHRQDHRLIFQAMLDIAGSGDPVDLTTITGRLFDTGELEKVGGLPFLAELSEHVGTAANIEYYARRVIDKHVLRQARQKAKEILAATEMVGMTATQLVEMAEGQFYNIGQQIRRGAMEALPGLAQAEVQVLEAISSGTAATTAGLHTGYHDLDRLITLLPSDMVVIAGRPSMGKTALGLNIAMKAAARGYHIGFFSLEMSRQPLVRRVLAATAEVDFGRIMRSELMPDDWARLYVAQDTMQSWPLAIDDSPGLSILDIRSQSRRRRSQGKLDLLIVDYLQLIKPTNRTRPREEQVAEISRGLKAIAKELDIPVIILAQLNRECEKRPDKRPRLSDLRESGAIEQDADLIMFLFREEVYTKRANGTTEVLVEKQRNGRTGIVRLVFRNDVQRFENMETV